MTIESKLKQLREAVATMTPAPYFWECHEILEEESEALVILAKNVPLLLDVVIAASNASCEEEVNDLLRCYGKGLDLLEALDNLAGET